MKTFACALLGIAVFAGSLAVGGEASSNDKLKLLQGLWRIREIRVHVVGDKNPGEAFQSKWRWSIKGNQLTWLMPDKNDKVETITLGERGKRKLIDLTNNNPQAVNGKPPMKSEKYKWTLFGIYEVEGNTLSVCMPINQAGSNLRPVEITGDEGSGCMVWILERVENRK